MKNYVEVIALFNSVGKKIPKYIILEDGKKIEIEKVIDVRFCASFKSGGLGERYTIKIQEKELYLFFENNLWYIENK